jgi:glucokinase
MGYTIGVDVGGTKVLGGVVDEFGAVLKTARRETPREGGRALTQAIADVARELMAEFKVDSVGVSAAGFVSSDRKTMLATPNIADWNGVDLDYELTSLIGLPVVIENDANAAAWGEARFGAGRGIQNMIMVTIGTGVGGGMVINGNLYRGAYGVAAEFGHIRVVPEGHLCGCGIRGCLEQYGSGSALMRHAREAIAASPDIARNLLDSPAKRLLMRREMETLWLLPHSRQPVSGLEPESHRYLPFLIQSELSSVVA